MFPALLGQIGASLFTPPAGGASELLMTTFSRTTGDGGGLRTSEQVLMLVSEGGDNTALLFEPPLQISAPNKPPADADVSFIPSLQEKSSFPPNYLSAPLLSHQHHLHLSEMKALLQDAPAEASQCSCTPPRGL